MTSQEYIILELNDFIVSFPQTRVRYEYDQLSDVHFIEVVPNSVYHLDEAYIKWESEMYDRFIASYPDQNICFISDDALVGLENAQLALTGSVYDTIYSTNRTETIVEESVIKVTGFVNINSFVCITSNFHSTPPTNNVVEVLIDSINLPLAA
ncbi:MAG: hypothetical protein JXR27_00930 [Paludibacteraceae bacterium]|nr:hypothetical protein [Paludibacteraceae bacterium]